MAELTAEIGNKSEGQLIKSAQWNRLVEFVDGLGAGLASLGERVGILEGRADGLRTDFDALTGRIDSLLAEYYRVTLETPQLTFALGGLAEITARLADVDGNPLAFAPGEARPTIDFVTTWGRLVPAPGFTSRAGSAGSSVSVTVNENGVARVRLRAGHTEGLGEQAVDEVTAALGTTLPGNNGRVGDAILAANTPQEARLNGAFGSLTTAYDRPEAGLFRSYADSYYLANVYRPNHVVAQIPPIVATPTIQWRDERATVLAFVKNDSDPRTPDPNRGGSSILVTFRDWVGPWIVMDYLPTFAIEMEAVRERFAGSITSDPTRTADAFSAQVRDVVRDQGLIGRQRDFLAVDQALESLPVASAPSFLPNLRDSFRDAVGLQRALDNTQFATAGGDREEIALRAVTQTSQRADQSAQQLETRIVGLETTLGDRNRTIEDLGLQVADFGRRVATIQEVDVAGLRTRVDGSERESSALGERVAGIDQGLAALNQSRLPGIEARVEEAAQLSSGLGRRVNEVGEAVSNLGNTRLAALEARLDRDLSSLRDLDRTVNFLSGRIGVERPSRGGGTLGGGGGVLGGGNQPGRG